MLNILISILIFGIIGAPQIAASNLSSLNAANKSYGKLPLNLRGKSHSEHFKAMLRESGGVVSSSLHNAASASSYETEIDDSAATVATTIPLGAGGTSPINVGVNPNTNRVYVGYRNSNNVSVINGAANTVTDSVTAGSLSIAIGVNPNTNRIYVANFGSDNVSVIDGSTNTVIATVAVGSNPARVEVNPVTNRIYVANFSSGSVSVIDGASNNVIATVAVGSNPEGIGVNPNTNRIYVGNRGSANVTVIDGASNNVTATVAAGSGPIAVDVNPVTNRIYVANFFSANVTVIDGASNNVTATVGVGGGPGGVGVNSNTNRIYVANFNSNSVSVINGAADTVTDTLSVGSSPFGVRVNLNTNRIYVVNFNSNNVSVIEDLSEKISDFTLIVNPSSQTVSAGASASFSVGVQGVNGFTQPVDLNATLSPSNSNVTVSLSSNTVNTGANATITVNTLAGTPSGSFNLVVNGTSGQITHSQMVSLNVMKPNSAPTIVAIADQTVKAGDAITVGVSATDPDGSTGLKLSIVSGPKFVTITDNGNGSGTINIAPSIADAQGGRVTVQAIDSVGLTAQSSFNVTVLPSLMITAASFAKHNLIINGTGFGASGAQVTVNGVEITSFIINQTDIQIMIKGSKKKLNLKKGQNQITVIAGGTVSNTFMLIF